MAKIQKINDFVSRRYRTNESADYNYKKQIAEWLTSIRREDNDVEHICITTRSIFDSLYDSLGAAAMNRLAMPNDSHWESMLRPNSGDDYILVLTGPSGYLNSDRKVSLVKNTEKYIIIVLEEGDSINVICDNPSNLSAIKARSLVVMPEGMNEGLDPEYGRKFQTKNIFFAVTIGYDASGKAVDCSEGQRDRAVKFAAIPLKVSTATNLSTKLGVYYNSVYCETYKYAVEVANSWNEGYRDNGDFYEGKLEMMENK